MCGCNHAARQTLGKGISALHRTAIPSGNEGLDDNTDGSDAGEGERADLSKGDKDPLGHEGSKCLTRVTADLEDRHDDGLGLIRFALNF